MAYFKLCTFHDLTKNTFHLEKSGICHIEIQNYNSNYVNSCFIITIIIIKIIILYCLLRFKAATKPQWFCISLLELKNQLHQCQLSLFIASWSWHMKFLCQQSVVIDIWKNLLCLFVCDLGLFPLSSSWA